MTETSHDLLAKVSPRDSAILTGPGTLKDKWPLLSQEGKDLLEQAISKALEEQQRMIELAEKTGLVTQPKETSDGRGASPTESHSS